MHEAEGFTTCGWRFHASDVFDLQQLESVFRTHEQLLRRKGIFRVDGRSVALNATDGVLDTAPLSDVRQSRADFIAQPGTTPDWQAIEADLVACLR